MQWGNKRLIGILLVNVATLVWATNMVLGRMIREDIGPITLSAARFLVAALIFAVLLQRCPPEERRLGQDKWLLAGMALTGVLLFSPVLYLGLHETTAVNGTLINGLSPLLTGWLAAWLLQSPMSRRQTVGALLALAGVAYLISGGSLEFWTTARANSGDLLVLLSVLIWGVYSVLGSKVMQRRSSVSATAFSIFLGLPVLVALAWWECRYVPVHLDGQLLLTVLYLGAFPAAVGFYSWNAGVARLGAGGAAAFYGTLPLYGALLGTLCLGESLGLHHWIGGALIIGGGALAARTKWEN
ncbi:MAG TPA: DMT family transporter [Patescibacteria group bacterium]|nr:DMT family transporter [Patescibacteria group bacterium]